MIYNNDEARTAAKENLQELINKFDELKPKKGLTKDTIEETLYFLMKLKDMIAHEEIALRIQKRKIGA